VASTPLVLGFITRCLSNPSSQEVSRTGMGETSGYPVSAAVVGRQVFNHRVHGNLEHGENLLTTGLPETRLRSGTGNDSVIAGKVVLCGSRFEDFGHELSDSENPHLDLCGGLPLSYLLLRDFDCGIGHCPSS